MKTLLKTVTIAFVVSILLISCSKDGDSNQSSQPPTQTSQPPSQTSSQTSQTSSQTSQTSSQTSQQTTALDFDPTSGKQQVEILGITCPTEFTFEAWINHREQSGVYPTILEFGNDAPFFGLENNNLTLYNIITSTSTISLNQWIHVAVTFSTINSEAKLYINGELEVTETGVTLFKYETGAGIGYNGTDIVFNGSIDDVRIWNVVRTDSEILLNMNKCLDGSEANLYALYNFNEGEGTVANDLTSNNFNGTLLNMDPATDWITSDNCD